jgi:hypothetical protein
MLKESKNCRRYEVFSVLSFLEKLFSQLLLMLYLPMVDLKLIFLCTLYDWMAALSGHSFSNLPDFLDCCKFN